jgi:hypothetical protein
LEITFGTISFNKSPEAYHDLSGLTGDGSHFGFDSTLTSVAMLTATAILSAKGTRREMVPAPTKLNAVRAKINKPPNPQHVVIKIGEVFDKNAKAHAFGHGSPCPRLRRGHIRQQAHADGGGRASASVTVWDDSRSRAFRLRPFSGQRR